tara:strand:- start:37 stop:489 length:453 start_codon:yes stop_codon:yes gene_type:complete
MKYYLLVLLFILSACQNESSLEEKYNKALTHKESKEYRESNVILFDILESPKLSEEMQVEVYFLLAQTFYDLKNYRESIKYYKKILDSPLDNEIRKKSLFMIAYTYFNDLEMYTDSIEYYTIFKFEYPKDELIAAVDFELEQINNILDKK